MRAEIKHLRQELEDAQVMIREYRKLTDAVLSELEGCRATANIRRLRSA
jgi:hypothetical protein